MSTVPRQAARVCQQLTAPALQRAARSVETHDIIGITARTKLGHAIHEEWAVQVHAPDTTCGWGRLCWLKWGTTRDPIILTLSMDPFSLSKMPSPVSLVCTTCSSHVEAYHQSCSIVRGEGGEGERSGVPGALQHADTCEGAR